MTAPGLAAPVLGHPHWRINYRPATYQEDLLPTLASCQELVEATKLSLRGWDFPHVGRHPGESEVGSNWIGSSTQYSTHIEYWRLYQSGQFLHLHAVREALEPEWRAKLRRAAQSHASWRTDINWDNVPGYFSFLNFLYTVTEVFEFAARIAQRGVYTGQLDITIELKGIKGFVLTPELDRAWSDVRASSQDRISKTWTADARDLIAGSADLSVTATAWFFERFGWLNPAIEVLRKDQTKFLKGQW